MVPPTTIEVPFDNEVEATMPHVLVGCEPESLPRLGASGDIEAHLAGDSARVAGSAGLSGITVESLMLAHWEPSIRVILRRGDV